MHFTIDLAVQGVQAAMRIPLDDLPTMITPVLVTFRALEGEAELPFLATQLPYGGNAAFLVTIDEVAATLVLCRNIGRRTIFTL